MANESENQGFLDFLAGMVKDRVSNPITSAVVLSWLIWNYKVVLIILSDLKVDEKFKSIEFLHKGYTFGFIPDSCVNYYILPFFFAVIYVVGWPLLTKGLYRKHFENKNEWLGIKDAALKAERYRNELEELRNSHIQDMSRLRDKISRVTNLVYKGVFQGNSRAIFDVDWDAGDNTNKISQFITKTRHEGIKEFPLLNDLKSLVTLLSDKRKNIGKQTPILTRDELDREGVVSLDDYEAFVELISSLGVVKIIDDSTIKLIGDDDIFDAQLAHVKKLLGIE